MDPLFLKSKDIFEKEAMVKLERDPKQWSENITAFLHQAYPWITDAKVQINFNRIDAEEGAGVGQIQLDDKVSIPIVVEKFKLQPLDVFWSEGKLQPLTKSSLLEILEGSELGTSIPPNRSGSADMALLSRTQVPYDGRYVYAKALDLSKDDIFKAANEAFDYDDLAVALTENPVFKEVMADWMKTAGNPANVITKGDLPMPKDVKGKVPGGFKTAADKAPSSNAGTAISGKGEEIKTWSTQGQASEGETHKPVKEDKIERNTHHPGVIKKGGVFDMAMEMDRVPCVVANHIISLDGQVKEGSMAAFELGGGRYFYGTNFIGYRPKGLEKVSAYGTNRVSGWGAFIYQTSNPMEILATEPVHVIHREKTAEGFDKIAVETIGGRRDLFISRDVKDWAEVDGNLHLSSKWTFKPCTQMQKVSGAMIVSPTGQAFLDKLAEWLQEKPAEKPAPRVGSSNLFKEASYIRPASAWFPLSSANGSNLVKVALDVTEDAAKKTVDAVLGLNFITPENSYKFADQLEKISEAKEACAKLLLAARLGLPLKQAPLKTAMFALDSAERDLMQFNNVMSSTDQH